MSVISTENSIMAGPVRQPIDVVALENYIGQYDLGISLPLNLKQVTSLPPKLFHTSIPEGTQEIKSSSPPCSLDLASPIRHT